MTSVYLGLQIIRMLKGKKEIINEKNYCHFNGFRYFMWM